MCSNHTGVDQSILLLFGSTLGTYSQSAQSVFCYQKAACDFLDLPKVSLSLNVLVGNAITAHGIRVPQLTVGALI